MLFSIIVPVYKVEPYIKRCVDSLLAQTFQDYEIILVDDGGTDNCPQICDAYAKADPRVKVIHKPNGGLSDARNAGLQIAEGEYVLFIDSDDAITHDALMGFAEIASKKYDMICGDGNVFGGTAPFLHIPEIGCFNGDAFLKKSLYAHKMPMAAQLSLYRKEFLCANNLYFKVGILHEDEQFTPRAFLKAESVYNSGITFYNYYIREGSITQRRDMRKNARDLYDTCCELAELYGGLQDMELRKLLLDSLVEKYLSIFQVGRIFQYGKSYIHKAFVRKYAYRKKTRIKAYLFCFSCRIYYMINALSKSVSK